MERVKLEKLREDPHLQAIYEVSLNQEMWPSASHFLQVTLVCTREEVKSVISKACFQGPGQCLCPWVPKLGSRLEESSDFLLLVLHQGIVRTPHRANFRVLVSTSRCVSWSGVKHKLEKLILSPFLPSFVCHCNLTLVLK